MPLETNPIIMRVGGRAAYSGVLPGWGNPYSQQEPELARQISRGFMSRPEPDARRGVPTFDAEIPLTTTNLPVPDFRLHLC